MLIIQDAQLSPQSAFSSLSTSENFYSPEKNTSGSVTNENKNNNNKLNSLT